MSHHVYPDTTSRDKDWRHAAACREEDPELFFPTGTTGPALLETEQAKAVCRRCPVVDACLQWAMDTGQEAGVWGGLSEDERRAIKRGRARDLTAEAMEKPRPARAQGTDRSFTALRDANTRPTEDGHVLWVGKRAISMLGATRTGRQIAYAADRGHLPDGRVLTECDVPVCVHPQHISDEQERNERALERLATAAQPEPVQYLEPVVAEQPTPAHGCGTPFGARTHEECGEELCDACWSAIADAVNRLNTDRVPA
jgi:WhiB family redox-sensing transcriptional regulator